MSATATRPLVWIVSLGLVSSSSLVIIAWLVSNHQLEHAVKMVSMISDDATVDFLSNVEDNRRMLIPINISALNLAGILSSTLDGNISSFSTIEKQVAHNMFLAFSIIPNVAQIAYFREDGLFFSYYKEGNQTFSLFANLTYSSFGSSPNNTNSYHWYKQQVNDITGLGIGEAIDSTPITFTKESWFYNALANKNGLSSWGLGLGETQEPMLLFMAPVEGVLPQGRHGVVSLGVPVKVFGNFIPNMDFHGWGYYLATEDGHFLAQAGSLPTSIIFSNGSIKAQPVKSKDAAVELSCEPLHSYTMAKMPSNSHINIWARGYKFYCTSLDIAGVRSISILGVPDNGFERHFPWQHKIALALLLLTLAFLISFAAINIILHVKAMEREISLSSALIKQTEATQQAERKSMNKSIAFARASHDVRTSLAAITGLIELCLSAVSPQSEIHTNLVQMNSCASNLLDILNSVLDTSKIEAGKVQLEEVEFDLVHVLEEIADIFYIVASKKGVEVLLDPCDGSILKNFCVKGDCGRLKQILSNLLSNAVKFTSEGHIIVRAWIKKPSLENSVLSSTKGGFSASLCSSLSQLFFKNSEDYDKMSATHKIEKNSKTVELTVEVDDSGKGIPKEKHKSVFENYVQVKESTSRDHEGTGLGLGIVQSLVRLMGGEISIVDKAYGEQGTCFKFNVYFHSCETEFSDYMEEKIKLYKDQMPSRDLKLEGLHAILLVRSNEERVISQRWMENYGIKVWHVNQLKNLYSAVETLNHKILFNQVSSSGKFDSTPPQNCSANSISYNSSDGEKGENLFSSNMITGDLCRKKNTKGAPNIVLITVDVSCGGSFSETCSVLAQIGKNTHDLKYKVVWLVNSSTPQTYFDSLESKKVPCDLILQKPFHGSRLIRLLQVCGVVVEDHKQEMMQVEHDSFKLRPKQDRPAIDTKPSESISLTRQRIIGMEGNLSSDKPLRGMKILVAEDNVVLQKLAITTLSRLGAAVEHCENGEAALKLIRKALYYFNGLHDGSKATQGLLKGFSYDIVLMDCEMPVMNGFEATKQIRIEEQRYGLHIPIIALTAHAMVEEANKCLQAGMDFHLTKPLKADKLLEAIHAINQTK